MVNMRRVFSASSFVLTCFLMVAGCGKPAPPPQGASEVSTAPTVDLGPESSPQSTAPTANDGAPAGAPGEQK
jgi:hypothetical protein